MLHSIEQRIANLPVLGAIERGFADLTARLDAIQIPVPQPVIDPTPAVDHLKRDLVRTQDSLEAVHSTLGHLVDRLAMIEGGIREARFAAEAPAPMPMPMPAAHADAAANAVGHADAARRSAATAGRRDRRRQQCRVPRPRQPPPHRCPKSQPPPAGRHRRPTPRRPLQRCPSPRRPSLPAPAMRERNPIDPKLPPDFPLEPGSGTPSARPPASAAERIAASEAALGGAKPGGANHPGQTNFIAAARRAAQAAAAAAPEASAAKPDDESDKAEKSIGKKMRSLFVGAGAVILVVAARTRCARHARSVPSRSPNRGAGRDRPGARPAKAGR